MMWTFFGQESESVHKDMDFDIAAHLQKESYLRQKVQQERKEFQEKIHQVEKEKQEIKQQARSVLQALKAQVDNLSQENTFLKQENQKLLNFREENDRIVNKLVQLEEIISVGNAQRQEIEKEITSLTKELLSSRKSNIDQSPSLALANNILSTFSNHQDLESSSTTLIDDRLVSYEGDASSLHTNEKPAKGRPNSHILPEVEQSTQDIKVTPKRKNPSKKVSYTMVEEESSNNENVQVNSNATSGTESQIQSPKVKSAKESIVELKKKLTNAEDTIQSLQEKFSTYESTVFDLKNQLVGRDTNIFRLQEEVSQHIHLRKEAEMSLEEQKKSFDWNREALEAEIKQCNEIIRMLEKDVDTQKIELQNWELKAFHKDEELAKKLVEVEDLQLKLKEEKADNLQHWESFEEVKTQLQDSFAHYQQDVKKNKEKHQEEIQQYQLRIEDLESRLDVVKDILKWKEAWEQRLQFDGSCQTMCSETEDFACQVHPISATIAIDAATSTSPVETVEEAAEETSAMETKDTDLPPMSNLQIESSSFSLNYQEFSAIEMHNSPNHHSSAMPTSQTLLQVAACAASHGATRVYESMRKDQSDLLQQVQLMADEKQKFRMKCKTHVHKLNDKLKQQEQELNRLKDILRTANETSTEMEASLRQQISVLEQDIVQTTMQSLVQQVFIVNQSTPALLPQEVTAVQEEVEASPSDLLHLKQQFTSHSMKLNDKINYLEDRLQEKEGQLKAMDCEVQQLEVQVQAYEVQGMACEDVLSNPSKLSTQCSEPQPLPVASNANTSISMNSESELDEEMEADALSVIGILQEKYSHVKAVLKQRNEASVQKIKSLQDLILSKAAEMKDLRKTARNLESKLVESQELMKKMKVKMTEMRDEHKKTIQHHQYKIDKLTTQYESQCQAVSKLKALVKIDRDRFEKLRQQMEAILKIRSHEPIDADQVSSSSPPPNDANDSNQSFSSLPDSQSNGLKLTNADGSSSPLHTHLSHTLQSMYKEEVEKRLQGKDQQSLHDIQDVFQEIQQQLSNTLSAIQVTSNIRNSAMKDGDETEDTSLVSKLCNRLDRLHEELEHKTNECLTLSTQILSLQQQLSTQTSSQDSHEDTVNSYRQQLHDKSHAILALTNTILDLEAKITYLQQEVATLTRLSSPSSMSSASMSPIASPSKDDNMLIMDDQMQSPSSSLRRVRELEDALQLTQQSLSTEEQKNEAWVQKHEEALLCIQEYEQKHHALQEELQASRQEVVELLMQVKEQQALASTSSDAMMAETNVVVALRKAFHLFLSAQSIAEIEAQCQSICTLLQIEGNEQEHLMHAMMKLAPMIVAYSSFESVSEDFTHALETIAEEEAIHQHTH